MGDYFDNTNLLNSINKKQAPAVNSNGNAWVYFTIGAIVITGIVIAVHYEYQLKNAEKINAQLCQRINQLEYFS